MVRYWNLEEIALFLGMKDMSTRKFSDGTSICYVVFLIDITCLLRDLNISHQGKHLLVVHFLDKISAFKMKLSL